jgi:hypothetical protein
MIYYHSQDRNSLGRYEYSQEEYLVIARIKSKRRIKSYKKNPISLKEMGFFL